ncbi:MAG: response regulator [Sedimentisphaerales bacterium]|nr:response regulator [Sedimentisphaerales bacterium]
MPGSGRILLADDEQTFRESTGELLRKEGYTCDCVCDADEAVAKLKENSYDLLIADIKMPGNPGLELVKELPELAKGMPTILVTGYPSQKTAIESIHLPVAAYMVKPVDFNELEKNVADAIQQRKLFDSVFNTKERLRAWQREMQDIEKALQKRHRSAFSASIKNFLDLTLGNISAALVDVKNLAYILTDEPDESAVCNLLNCPRLIELTEGLTETVRILERTKSSFKSKELGDLRVKLEKLLKKAKKLKVSPAMPKGPKQEE